MNSKQKISVVPAPQVVEGGGFVVRRPFPADGISYVDPFLLIDEMGPVEYAPGKAIGAPDHPHRGFETVTYIIDGQMEHEDSHGHRGSIRSGDVQWMTAGAGVIHSEMPSQEMLHDGGRMHGFQIWINLPREKKMSQPRYQEYNGGDLPLVEDEGRWIRVIAGEAYGRKSPIETTVPATMLHVKLRPGAEATVPVAAGSNVIAHAISGAGSFQGTPLIEHNAAILQDSTGAITLRGDDVGLEVLLLAGLPLGEPVARYGPFVMNTTNELERAFEDYRSGNFGEIARAN